MEKTYIEEVLVRAEISNVIHEILGLEYEDWVEMNKKFKNELFDIIRTQRFTLAAAKLLEWLGVPKEEIDPEKMSKAILVVKSIVYLHNKLAKKIKDEL